MFQNPTANLNALCQSCAKIACCSSQLIVTSLYAASNIQTASSSSSAVSKVVLLNALFIQPHKQKPNGVRAGGSNIYIPANKTRHRFIPAFFLTKTDIFTPKTTLIFEPPGVYREWFRQQKGVEKYFVSIANKVCLSIPSHWCLELDIKLSNPKIYFIYHQLKIQQFYVLPTQCIYVFCEDLRTNSDYFSIQL